MAGRPHGAGEKSAVEQVKHRVLDPADVLVNRQPGIGQGAIGRRGFSPRIGKAGEIPRGVDERVLGVGFAASGPATGWTADVLPGRVMFKRVAGPSKINVLG